MIPMQNLVNANEKVKTLISHTFRYFSMNAPKIAFAGADPYGVMYFGAAEEKEVEYLTVAQMSQRFPAFTQGSIRWLIFNEKDNGFSKVIRRIGRKVIINLQEFKKYIEEQSQ
jgi:hypothetical protein